MKSGPLYRWTRPQYERLIDAGFLDEDDPVELLDGLLIVKEPQASPHRTSVLVTAKALERAFGEGWFVQTQSPISLDDRFPDDFMFQLSRKERDSLRSQSVISNAARGRGGRRYSPYVFTEQGVACSPVSSGAAARFV